MPGIETYPLTLDRWPDVEKLFGPRGACGGCWCMWWRLTRSQFEKQKGEPNRLAFQQIVESSEIPGLLAYRHGEPIGWVCIGPREKFQTLERSRVLARIDDQPVWSVVCFFIAKGVRRQGVSKVLLKAAVEFAGGHGAKIVEGYPVPLKSDSIPDVFAYTGLESIFHQVGFKIVARRGKNRAIFRLFISR